MYETPGRDQPTRRDVAGAWLVCMILGGLASAVLAATHDAPDMTRPAATEAAQYPDSLSRPGKPIRVAPQTGCRAFTPLQSFRIRLSDQKNDHIVGTGVPVRPVAAKCLWPRRPR